MRSSWTGQFFKGKDTHNRLATVKKPSNISKLPASAANQQKQHMCQVFYGANTSHSFSNPQPDMVVSGDVQGKGYYIYQGPRIVAEVRCHQRIRESTSRRALPVGGGGRLVFVRGVWKYACIHHSSLRICVTLLPH